MLAKTAKNKTLPTLAISDFKSLFESTIGLYLILTPEFRIAAVNNAYLKATMTKREEITGRYIFDVFPDNPNDPDATGTHNLSISLNRVLMTHALHAMAIQKYDIRRPASEGGGFEERYWLPVNFPMLDKKGEVVYIIHNVEDVTKVVHLDKQRQEQIKENEALRTRTQQMERQAFMQMKTSESHLKSLVDTVLDTIIDGVITINKRGLIQSYNKACVKLFGYRPEDVMGKNMHMLMPESYHREHDDYLTNFQKNGEAKNTGTTREISGRRKDGSVFPMEFAVGETIQGGDHAFVGIIRDITERHEAEKAHDQLRHAQKMESLGQLTGGIAHDFNNLLAVVLGNLDFMTERTTEDHPLRAFIDPSIEAAEHGAELTKQLLAFGRKQALQPKIISINELLHYFKALVKHTLGERVEIILALESDVWNVDVDPSQLQNALLNLAVNARDAMPNGGKLVFETQNASLDEEYASNNADVTPGDYVIVAASDTGEGMSPEIMEKAFEPFFTTKDIGKGSGLGLSMVYGFVKQSAGHIKLYSELGHGTSIKIYLPRAEGTALNIVDAKVKPAAPPTQKTKMILVVEDNKNVLKLTSSMVEALGYKVLQAESGDKAMKMLEANQSIELLLTDVMLPGEINGPALAKKAAIIYPKLKVLFNSGYAEHAILQTGILEEGVHLISKPFRKQQLASKIEEVLKQE